MGPLHSDSLDEFILSWVKNPKKFEKHFIFTLFTTNILVETWTYSVIFQQQKQDIKETVLLTSSFDECFEQPLSTRTLGLVFLEHIFSYAIAPLERLGSQVRRNFPRYFSYSSSGSTIPATVYDLLVSALQDVWF